MAVEGKISVNWPTISECGFEGVASELVPCLVRQTNPISAFLGEKRGSRRKTDPIFREQPQFRISECELRIRRGGERRTCLGFRALVLRACFEFRDSDFGLSAGPSAPNEPNFGVFGLEMGVRWKSKANFPGERKATWGVWAVLIDGWSGFR
mgnify:CR=1 FL=1